MTQATTPPKIYYDLPKFDDWQANPEWRIHLEANVYVDGLDVGRGAVVTGRLSWRTIPHRPDAEGWLVNGHHLYRVDGEEYPGLSTRQPTDKMVERAREAIAPLLEEPSDAMRLRVAEEIAESRNRRAQQEFERTNSDTVKLLNRVKDALAVPLDA